MGAVTTFRGGQPGLKKLFHIFYKNVFRPVMARIDNCKPLFHCIQALVMADVAGNQHICPRLYGGHDRGFS